MIPPYGGRLVDLLVPEEERAEARAYASTLPSLQMSPRVVCDLELLASGGFSPLDRFMGESDFRRVLAEMRLADGTLFPIPVTLPVAADAGLRVGTDIALRDSMNDLLAIMTIDELYPWDPTDLAERVLGTHDSKHPLVHEMARWGRLNASGPIRVLQFPRHYDFQELRRTPAQTREVLAQTGRQNVVAFQTRNPLHRVHEELTKRAIAAVDGVLLLHPSVGMTKPGDVDHYTRVRTYKALAQNYYDPDRIVLSLLPLAMRMAGPREALWHAIIRRNHGANHLIVGRDHAGPGKDSNGKPFYGPYDAQELVRQFQDEVGVTHDALLGAALSAGRGSLRGDVEDPRGHAHGHDLRHSGARGVSRQGPSPAGVVHPARRRPRSWPKPIRLDTARESASGSRVSAARASRQPRPSCRSSCSKRARQVTVLDGDVVRTHLSKGLGFSREDRDTNILRIGFVASEIVRHGGTVMCAAVSPYRETRDAVRAMMDEDQFIEVFVDTPLVGVRAAGREGDVREGAARRDQGVYRHQRSLRVTAESRDHARYGRFHARGQRAAHHGRTGAARVCALGSGTRRLTGSV